MENDLQQQPKYEVIGQYRDCEFQIGTILEPTDNGKYFIDRSLETEYYWGVPTDEIDQWPHVFKKINQ